MQQQVSKRQQNFLSSLEVLALKNSSMTQTAVAKVFARFPS
jgi:hypothetical protein